MAFAKGQKIPANLEFGNERTRCHPVHAENVRLSEEFRLIAEVNVRKEGRVEVLAVAVVDVSSLK